MSDPRIPAATAEALQELADAALKFMVGNLDGVGVPIDGVQITIACKSGHLCMSHAIPPGGEIDALFDAVRGYLDHEVETISIATEGYAPGGDA